MTEKKGITAFLVVFNEEKVIERCLESLIDVVDEIIIIHDGHCEDKTLEISGKYTNKIYESSHRGMGELHVIEALELCEYEWVLRIDADEYLSKELRDNIGRLIDDKYVDAYTFIWRIWDGKRYLTDNFPRKKSLCKKTKIFFIEFPGQELQTTGNTKNTDYILEHKPLYNNYTFSSIKKKWKRWIKIHANYYINKSKIRFFQCPINHQRKFLQNIELQAKLAHLMLCSFWFMYSFLKAFIKREYYRNIRTWKIAFYQGVYGWFLCKYISEQKK